MLLPAIDIELLHVCRDVTSGIRIDLEVRAHRPISPTRTVWTTLAGNVCRTAGKRYYAPIDCDLVISNHVPKILATMRLDLHMAPLPIRELASCAALVGVLPMWSCPVIRVLPLACLHVAL